MLKKIVFLVFLITFSNQLFAEWTYSSKLTFDYYYDSVIRSKYTQTKPSLLLQNEQFKLEFSYLLPEKKST